MDSPTQQSVSVRSSTKERRALLIIIIVVALGVLGWLSYQHFFKKSQQETREEKGQAILKQIGEQSADIRVSDEEKAAVLEQVGKESASNKNTGLTDEQKAEIIQSMSTQ